MMFLTSDDLYQLTNKKRYVSQICALAKMQIPFRVRPDGSPVVLWSSLDQAMIKQQPTVFINTAF